MDKGEKERHSPSAVPFSPEIHAPTCCAHPSEPLAHLKPANRRLEGLGQLLAFPSSVVLLLVLGSFPTRSCWLMPSFILSDDVSSSSALVAAMSAVQLGPALSCTALLPSWHLKLYDVFQWPFHYRSSISSFQRNASLFFLFTAASSKPGRAPAQSRPSVGAAWMTEWSARPWWHPCLRTLSLRPWQTLLITISTLPPSSQVIPGLFSLVQVGLWSGGSV